MTIFADNQHFIFGASRYKSGGRFGPLYESYMNLVVVHKGRVTVTSDNANYVIPEGQTSLIYNENVVELIFPRDKKTEITWCETGETLASREALSRMRESPHVQRISERLDTLMWMGAKLEAGEGYNYELIRNSLGVAVFHEYFYQATLLEQEQPLPKAVLRAKRYIELHYKEHCDMEKITQIAGMTPQYLCKMFKKSLNCTPNQYLWQVRTENGGHLLCRTNLNISEIAYQCGFQTPFHFSRHIKKVFGYSPRELRKRHWHREPSTIKENVIPDSLEPNKI